MIVVLDTNVFVAAGFRAGSASARIVALVRAGRVRLAWDDATRGETEAVLRRIPPLDADAFVDLFAPEGRCDGAGDPAACAVVPDPGDRKFAALAAAAGAVLVTNDDDLLGVRDRLDALVLTPAAFLDLFEAEAAN